MSFDVKQCIVDLKARVPNPPTVPLPASCLPNGGAFDPIACLDGLTPPLPVPPPPPAPPSLPPTPLAPRPPVAFPAECDAGTLYACARALVLQVTGSDCLLRDPIGACLEPTDDPAGPVPIVPPLSDPLSVVVPNICPAATEYAAHWLGTAFEGLPAGTPTRACELPDPVLGRNVYVSYSYGSCVAPEHTACLPPLEVQSAPLCERNYRLYTQDEASDSAAYPSSALTVKGVPARSFDGGTVIEIYTGFTTIAVMGRDPAQVRRAADIIRPVPPSVQLPVSGFPAPSVPFSGGSAPTTTPVTLPEPAPSVYRSAVECVPALDMGAARLSNDELVLPVENVFRTTAITGTVTAELPGSGAGARASQFSKTSLGRARIARMTPGGSRRLALSLTREGRRALARETNATVKLRFRLVGRLPSHKGRRGPARKVYDRKGSLLVPVTVGRNG